VTQAAWVKQNTGGRGLWSFDGYMMYRYIAVEYHSHLLATFNPIVDKPIILTNARRKD